MLNRLLLIIIAVAAMMAAVGLWEMLDQSVQRLVVLGDLTAMERQTVEQRLMTEEVQGILTTDIDALKQAIVDLEWARKVSIRRVWPDQVEVRLDRELPIARWGSDEYLSAAGEVMSLPDTYPGLPRLTIAASAPAQALETYRLFDQVAAREGLRIGSLQEDPRGQWQVTFSNGLTVQLGRAQLNQRMHRFLLAYRQIVKGQSGTIEYVDARYDRGVALRFTDEPLVATAQAEG